MNCGEDRVHMRTRSDQLWRIPVWRRSQFIHLAPTVPPTLLFHTTIVASNRIHRLATTVIGMLQPSHSIDTIQCDS